MRRYKGLEAGSAIELHGVPRRTSNWTLIDSERQIQFRTIDLELTVHPCHRRRVSEVRLQMRTAPRRWTRCATLIYNIPPLPTTCSEWVLSVCVTIVHIIYHTTISEKIADVNANAIALADVQHFSADSSTTHIVPSNISAQLTTLLHILIHHIPPHSWLRRVANDSSCSLSLRHNCTHKCGIPLLPADCDCKCTYECTYGCKNISQQSGVWHTVFHAIYLCAQLWRKLSKHEDSFATRRSQLRGGKWYIGMRYFVLSCAKMHDRTQYVVDRSTEKYFNPQVHSYVHSYPQCAGRRSMTYLCV